jgi:hypothetical protein
MRIPVLALLLLAPAAAAQDSGATLESLAVVQEFERAELDPQSIQSQGELTRFDVRVDWRDPAQKPPGAPAGRYIRFVAKCAGKSLRVAAVATLDDNGRMLKSHVVPPGGSDFLVPAAGSREAGWMQAACR